jgi:putative ABC transport system permease protein
VLKEFLPIDIPTTLSWSSIAQGVVLGTLISLLFALLPLVSIRRISPLNTLRIAFQQQKSYTDPVRWLIYGLVLLFIFGFTYLQMDNWQQALAFTTGVILAFLILIGIAVLLMWVVRRFFPGNWSYLWRQGLANLYRPNNQTTILIVSIGLGTAFICTLVFMQSLLLNRLISQWLSAKYGLV